MPKLPRAECHVCHKSVPVRRDGELREHRTLGQLCAGSGRRARNLSVADEHALKMRREEGGRRA